MDDKMAFTDRARKGCRRCGSKDIAWNQNTQGKWYLTEVFDTPFGSKTHYRDFHSVYCGNAEKHDTEQARITAEYQADTDQRQFESEERENQRIQGEAVALLYFSNLSVAERAEFIEEKKDNLARLNRENVSMDHFVEAMRHRQAIAALTADIDLLEDFNSELED